mgnify:CR=1 FL=1
MNSKLQEELFDIDKLGAKIKDAKDEGINVEYKKIKDERSETAIKDYKSSMMKEFNHFLSNITNKLKYILDIALQDKGCLLETSISVKQFNRKVEDVGDIKDVTVITTFRDSQSYSQGKREIGEKAYSILGNTDFQYCLTHPYFLKNNICKNDRTYDNENKEFLEYYNCTIVVPIKYSYPDSTIFYGYLACDIFNTDFAKDNLLDDKMAEIIEATAGIMGSYFDSIDYQWSFFLNDDFMDVFFKMKKK